MSRNPNGFLSPSASSFAGRFARRATGAAWPAACAPTVLALFAGVSGCMVGPDYERPDAALNGAWQTNAGITDEHVDIRWWESFGDPLLTSLVESAYSQNLSLRAAGLRVLEARAARGIEVGRFFPQMQEAFGSVANNQLSANDAVSGADRSFATTDIGLRAAWELDFWGKFRRGIEAADAELLASVADYDAALVSLASDVATNYIFIRALEERLEFARANVRLQAETLELTSVRFRAGAVSELDVSTARATLANTQALIPDFEHALRQAKLALCLLLARTPSELDDVLLSPTGAERGVPVAPAIIAAGVPADLLRRRPDVRTAERIAAAESARIGQAVADLLPRISISGATGFASSTFEGTRQPGLGNVFDSGSFAGFIGLEVNWPVLNYGRITGNIRVRDARYEQAVASYQESALRAAGEVEAGLSEFLRSQERAGRLGDAVDASERSVELSLIQYRAGAVDFIRVNAAQADLVEQQDGLVRARADIALGAVRTYRALGGGWEIREGREFIDEGTAERMRRRTNWGDVLGPGWESGKDMGFSRPDAGPNAPGEDK